MRLRNRQAIPLVDALRLSDPARRTTIVRILLAVALVVVVAAGGAACPSGWVRAMRRSRRAPTAASSSSTCRQHRPPGSAVGRPTRVSGRHRAGLRSRALLCSPVRGSSARNELRRAAADHPGHLAVPERLPQAAGRSMRARHARDSGRLQGSGVIRRKSVTPWDQNLPRRDRDLAGSQHGARDARAPRTPRHAACCSSATSTTRSSTSRS